MTEHLLKVNNTAIRTKPKAVVLACLFLTADNCLQGGCSFQFEYNLQLNIQQITLQLATLHWSCTLSQQTFTCLTSTIETLEKSGKYVQN